MAETMIAVGDAGVGVFAEAGVMLPGVEAKLVCAKVKAVPEPPMVVFCNVNVGFMALVKVQVKSERASTLAAGIVNTPADIVPMEPLLPVMALLASVQDADVNE